jgi:hypothetical protein
MHNVRQRRPRTASPGTPWDVVAGTAEMKFQKCVSRQPGWVGKRVYRRHANGLGLAGSWVSPQMFITTAVNVGIGTMSPRHLFHVAGTIGAKEVIVSFLLQVQTTSSSRTTGWYRWPRSSTTSGQIVICRICRRLKRSKITSVRARCRPRIGWSRATGSCLQLFKYLRREARTMRVSGSVGFLSSKQNGCAASAFVMFLAMPASGQWASCANGSPSGSVCLSSGNAGIGKTAPQAQLDVVQSTYGPGLVVRNRVNPELQTTDCTIVTKLQTATGQFGLVGTESNSDFYLYTNNTQRAVIQAGENVGIGTTNPQHLLHVAGTIGAEEVIVSSTGADYVFEPAYRLPPLSEVDEYIRQNHHLPDIPSATKTQKKGASIGDLQAKLLAKIEELTLHMIEEHEANQRVAKQNQDLQVQNRMIRQKIGALEVRMSR